MLLTRKSFLTGAAAIGLARPASAKDWTTIRVATEGASRPSTPPPPTAP